jgi:xanthine dehydrogenase accessory factor
VCLVSVIEGQGLGAKMLVRPGIAPVGTLGHAELDRVVERDALAELEVGRSGVRSYGAQGQQRENDLTVFVESQAPPPRMLIFGAVDFTAALASAAKLLGYRVVVADARPVFATRKRFPMADELRVSWPDDVFDEFGDELGPRDAVAVLTHDNKFDVPAVVRALETRVGYIGVMGSRKTHDGRTERLREAGVDDRGLARLRSPIGIDIGGRTPEETAVSICAEIIALRSGRKISALTDTEGPIHER